MVSLAQSRGVSPRHGARLTTRSAIIPTYATRTAELLTSVKSAQIAIETQSPQNPGVFKPVGQADYVPILMPMSLR